MRWWMCVDDRVWGASGGRRVAGAARPGWQRAERRHACTAATNLPVVAASHSGVCSGTAAAGLLHLARMPQGVRRIMLSHLADNHPLPLAAGVPDAQAVRVTVLRDIRRITFN